MYCNLELIIKKLYRQSAVNLSESLSKQKFQMGEFLVPIWYMYAKKFLKKIALFDKKNHYLTKLTFPGMIFRVDGNFLRLQEYAQSIPRIRNNFSKHHHYVRTNGLIVKSFT